MYTNANTVVIIDDKDIYITLMLKMVSARKHHLGCVKEFCRHFYFFLSKQEQGQTYRDD